MRCVMENQELGNVIKDYRKAAKLTQKQLADRLGKAESTVRMWELGKNTPPLDTLKMIGETLNVPLGELLTRAGYYEEFKAMVKENLNKPPTIPTFREAIRSARHDNYDSNEEQIVISLSEIAEKTNIPVTTLESIENGEDIQLSDIQIKELAEALDLSFAYLYLLAGKATPFTNQDIVDLALIQLSSIPASYIEKVVNMTFEEFSKYEMTLSNYELEINTIKKIYDICIFADKLNRIIEGYTFFSAFSFERLLNLSEIPIQYMGKTLSNNDKRKILAKIEEMKDDFEYQD